MKCLDGCHNYQMDTFMQSGINPVLSFYRMSEDGTKIDGVTNEEVLEVLIHRINYLNDKFYCDENSRAIDNLKEALNQLNLRTEDRVRRSVEGTHTL